MCIRLINKKPSTNLTSPTITVPASGTVVLLENGEHDVREYAKAKVEVKQPEGVIEITENGIHNIADYAEANVNVVPDNIIDYWSTEQNTSGLNLKNYIKEAPRNIDVSNKTSLSSFFSSSTSLENADLNNWNTENCTDFSSMFSGCKKLKSVKANNLNTSKITTISNMFLNCQELKTIDLKNWDTPNLTKMDTAFNGCSSLEYLDIRNFTFNNVVLSGWAIFSNVPNNCLIIVKGDTEKAWVKARNSSFTNIKTVAEIEGV